MEYVILGLLMIENFTLYKLNQAFKQGISMFYSASYGSLQVAVKNLLGKGWAVFEERVEKGRNQKVYSITPAGREAFFRWMLDEIPVNKLEVTALSKVYFLGLIPTVQQKRQIVQEILNKIDRMVGELSEMNDGFQQFQVPAPYREVFKYSLKTLDYGLQSHRFARDWFAGLLNELI